MATRFGHQLGEWLVQHGWAWAPMPDDEQIFGDRQVIDPQTGDEVDPYEGVKRHAARTDQSPCIPGLEKS